MMESKIRIGSRDSRLAIVQAEIIRDAIYKHHPEVQIEIVTMKTTGDRILDRSLDKVGGKGSRRPSGSCLRGTGGRQRCAGVSSGT